MVIWTNQTNVSINGNTISATGTTYNNTCRSQSETPATGGTITFTPNNNLATAGLAKDPYNGESGFNDIEYVLYTSGPHIAIKENGTTVATFLNSWTNGDEFQITQSETGEITYHQNSSLIYTSTITDTDPLYGHIILYANTSIEADINFVAATASTEDNSFLIEDIFYLNTVVPK